MDHNFWLERWNNQEIGFHQAEINPALGKFWPRLEVPRGARVFVPLCGKSLDMVWLAQQGYRVVGSELSERAVDDFFVECGLVPATRRDGDFLVKSSGPYEIWCGDYFALPDAAVKDVTGVYDRAALIALPAEMQRHYADKMQALVPRAPILLITIDYDQSEMTGPPFSTPRSTVDELFGARYDCEQLVSKDALEGNPSLKERGLTALTGSAFMLKPR